MLTKITVAAALNTELDEHLDHGRHQASDNANPRNGYTNKALETEGGQFLAGHASLPEWYLRAAAS